MDLLDGEEDGEYNGIGFVEIPKILAMKDTTFLGVELFDGSIYLVQVGLAWPCYEMVTFSWLTVLPYLMLINS